MPSIPIFPLGSVLFPHMPIALRIFEERYLKMVGELLESDSPIFGVVLIERGSEVGGGDERFSFGTTVKIIEIKAPEGPLLLLGQGDCRFRIEAWIEERPYPLAQIEFLENLVPSEIATLPTLDGIEKTLRRLLFYAESANLSGSWPSDVSFSDDPVKRIWQMSGAALLGPLDQQHLLESSDFETLVLLLKDKLDSTIKLLGPGPTG